MTEACVSAQCTYMELLFAAKLVGQHSSPTYALHESLTLSLSISLCVCQFQVKLFAVHTSLLLMFDKVDPYLARLPSGPIDNKYFIVVLILLSIGKHLIAHLIV